VEPVRDSRPRSLDAVRAAAIGATLVIAVAACSSSASAGWTFAPEPSVTLPAPVSGSGAPSALPSPGGGPGASGAPVVSFAPGTSPNPAGSQPAGGGTTGESTVRVKALNLAFDTRQIQAPAGQSFIIEFDNQDPGIPHNIDIKDPSGTSAFKGDLLTGPGQTTYHVSALTKGVAYTFQCDVHPTMTGTVSVQ
jgi:plastocyanin